MSGARISSQDGAGLSRFGLHARTTPIGRCRLVLLAMTAMSCRETASQKAETRRASLGQDRIALIGSDAVSAKTVAKVQAVSNVDATQALEQLIQVRLLGNWAKAGGLSQGRRGAIERALLARKLLERLDEQSRVPPEPSDAEIEAISRERWFDFDRPKAAKVAHVVVTTEGSSEAAARVLAQRIALAVKGTTDEAAFLEKARAVPVDGAKVVAESLPPVTEDGRTLLIDPSSGKPVAPGGSFDLTFARAAASLGTVGSQSGLVRTPFGFHVLLLTQRIDGYVMPMIERRQRLTSEVVTRRAQSALQQLRERLRKQEPPELERAALEWTGRVRVAE